MARAQATLVKPDAGDLAARRRIHPLRALAHPSFRRLWLTSVLTQTGLWVSTVSLQWMVVQRSGADPLSQGVLALVSIGPSLALAPLGGALADRFDRRRLMIAAQLALAAIAVALAAVTWNKPPVLPIIFLLAAALGAATAFTTPVTQVAAVDSVPTRDIGNAVSLQTVGFNLSRVAGPAVAAPILIFWGPSRAFAAYAGAAAAAALLASTVTLRRLSSDRARPRAGWWSGIRRGLAHAAERPPALAVLALTFTVSMGGASYFALLPVFAHRELGLAEWGYSVLLMATGVGAVVGAVTSGGMESASSVAGLVARVAALAAALTAFSLAPNLALAAVGAFLIGGLYFAALSSFQVTVQYLVDDDTRGRVMGVYLLSLGGVPIGGLLAGLVAHGIGTRMTVLVFAMGTAALAALVLKRARGRVHADR